MESGIDIAVVRHGQSTGNLGGRVLGSQLAPDLTPLGRTQAQRAASELADWGADQLWSSDMTRARRTAETIAQTTGLAITMSPLLREQDHGSLDGTRPEHLVAVPNPPGLDVTEVRWGGGESIVDVYARMRVFMGMIAARGGHRVIVVGHSDMSCVLSSMLLGLSHRQMIWDRLDHGQVRYLRWEPGQGLPA